ncbi:MAG: O-antigen ligase family protein, partial [Paracoccaceae bacterium]|nr:O-antigen ligase family protein [Paracoccaceae bacterium]
SNWVYGFFPHSFGQHARGGSWRPLVFLNHGLELGFFLFMSVIAAFTLTRTGTRDTRMVMTIAGCWLFGILLISSNTGAAMLAILFVPVLLFLPLRMQLMMASIIAVIFLIYPMLRQADILPMDSVVQGFSLISEDRARSFEFRVRNEDILLERAYEKPLFGWGPWARGQVFNDRGDMISVPDGIWIITLGNRGWVGFLTFFGLLAVPLLHLGRAARRKTLSAPTAGLAIMAAGNLMYMVPNSTVSPISAMMFGLLAGYAQWDAVRAPEETEEGSASKDPPLRGVPRYTRFAPGEGSRVTRREIKPRG